MSVRPEIALIRLHGHDAAACPIETALLVLMEKGAVLDGDPPCLSKRLLVGHDVLEHVPGASVVVDEVSRIHSVVGAAFRSFAWRCAKSGWSLWRGRFALTRGQL